MKFPQKLRLLMTRRGLTQQALGAALGGSHRMVGKWLAEASRPAASQMLRLADFFRVSVDVLADDGRDLPAQFEMHVGDEVASEVRCKVSEEIEIDLDLPPSVQALVEVRSDLEAMMRRVDAIIAEIAQPDAGGKLARMLREDAEERAANRRAGQEEQRKTGQG